MTPSTPAAVHSPVLPSDRFSPRPSQSLDQEEEQQQEEEEDPGDDSESDASSNVTTVSVQPDNSAFVYPPRSSSIIPGSHNNSTSNLPSQTARPRTTFMPQNDPSFRKPSGRNASSDVHKHRPRQHSQGFFEPSLPTASYTDATISASRIAAQAAMQHQQSQSQYIPKRPQLVTNDSEETVTGRRGASVSPPPPPPPPPMVGSAFGQGQGQGQHLTTGGNANVATSAANAAFPRSPGLPPEPVPVREHKHKSERSKMKLFSKPKHIGIGRDKDLGRDRAMPSPSKMGFAGASGLSRIVSGSTSSLVDPPPNHQSMYSLSNASTGTVVPSDRQTTEKEKDKDKDKAHRHHFLPRPKLKLKDRDDHYNLPLSSASSNSKPSDPNAPQSLYSFTPSSPVVAGSAFGKSVSGLDILHGGRALREKKKEEKALAESEHELANSVNGATPAVFPGPGSVGSSAGTLGEAALRETLQGFGLHNMSPDDAWDLLKAKLLVIFDGEDVRNAIEDLNKLVLIHIQRCVQKRAPAAIIADLRQLLETGCASLNQSLNGVPDERLVPHLAQIWMLVFGTVLPFMQAVFLPLDLEFKGCGTVMNLREASEFWGSVPNPASPTGSGLDVRNLVLTAFRDMVVLHRYEGLITIFSHLSLNSIDLGPSLSITSTNTTTNSSNGVPPASSASFDTGYGSFGSQSSTLLTAAGSYSSDSMSANRSRATSNTSSNPDQLIFQSLTSPPQRPNANRPHTADTSQAITETVGRMLQCVSVLASVQTGDEAQEKIETLSKALKHNWLGRGRAGRDRRGFVGTKIRPPIVTESESDLSSMKRSRTGESDWTSSLRDASSEVSAF